MADTMPTEPTTADRDTMLIGLTAIGVRLYANVDEAPPESILAAERAVFAQQFDPIWSKLTNDDHRWLREKLDDQDNGDGAFGRMVADYESRRRQPRRPPVRMRETRITDARRRLPTD
jgi:hypothetical protein